MKRKGCTVKVSKREGEKYRKWEKVCFSDGKLWRLRYTAFRAGEVYKGVTSCPYSAEKTPGSYRKIVRGGGVGAYSAIWRILSYTLSADTT